MYNIFFSECRLETLKQSHSVLQISNLEAAVNRINGKITKVQEQTQDIEELLNEDGKLMRKLDQDFDSLMSAASTHKDMLEKLEQSSTQFENVL